MTNKSGPEAQVKIACRRYLREIGAYVFSPVQMGFGAATVDDLVCYRTKFIGVEYKRPEGGKLTNRQRRCIEEIQGGSSRGLAVVVMSVPQLRQFIDENFPLE